VCGVAVVVVGSGVLMRTTAVRGLVGAERQPDVMQRAGVVASRLLRPHAPDISDTSIPALRYVFCVSGVCKNVRVWSRCALD
jgi:hypothetical protein